MNRTHVPGALMRAPGIAEALVLWILLGLVAVAVAVTYTRRAPVLLLHQAVHAGFTMASAASCSP